MVQSVPVKNISGRQRQYQIKHALSRVLAFAFISPFSFHYLYALDSVQKHRTNPAKSDTTKFAKRERNDDRHQERDRYRLKVNAWTGRKKSRPVPFPSFTGPEQWTKWAKNVNIYCRLSGKPFPCKRQWWIWVRRWRRMNRSGDAFGFGSGVLAQRERDQRNLISVLQRSEECYYWRRSWCELEGIVELRCLRIGHFVQIMWNVPLHCWPSMAPS